MKKLLLFTLLLVLSFTLTISFLQPVIAQITFQKVIPGTSSTGHSVQQTGDGGYVIAGDKDSIGGYYDDIVLVKTDNYGNTLGMLSHNDLSPEKVFIKRTNAHKK